MSDHYKQEVLLFMYDLVQNRMSMSFSNLFCNKDDISGSHETKQADLFYTAATKSKFVDKFPLYGIHGTLSLC